MNLFDQIGNGIQGAFNNLVGNKIVDVSTQIGKGIADLSGINKPDINYGDYKGNWMKYLEDMAASGDEASIDKLINYLMSENSAMTARNWTANREDTQYQRLVADMKAAGINPYFAMQGSSPISSSSSGNSYSGNYASTASYRSGLLASKYMGNATDLLNTGSKYLNAIVQILKTTTAVMPVIGAAITALAA